MKKVFLLILSFSLLATFSGCTKKVEEKDYTKVMNCTKNEPFNGTAVEWTTNLEVEYNSKAVVTNTVVKYIIKVDESLPEEKKEAFKQSIYNECDIEPGKNFDSCAVKEESNTYTVKLSTNNLSLVESAINDDSDSVTNIKDLKELLETKEYVCTLE